MIVFITVILGKCGAGPVRRRSWLGVAGVMIIAFSGVAAYGLNSGFGEFPRGFVDEHSREEGAPGLIDSVLAWRAGFCAEVQWRRSSLLCRPRTFNARALLWLYNLHRN